MGLFNKLVGNDEVSLTPIAGLALAAITMTAIDGDVDEDELAIIRRLVRGIGSGWDEAFKAFKTKNVGECISLVTESMNKDQQLVTMANLIDIAMADGVLAGDEQALLEAYMDAFDVEESDVEKIIDVISVKNSTSLF